MDELPANLLDKKDINNKGHQRIDIAAVCDCVQVESNCCLITRKVHKKSTNKKVKNVVLCVLERQRE